jgi:hypothetical protein
MKTGNLTPMLFYLDTSGEVISRFHDPIPSLVTLQIIRKVERTISDMLPLGITRVITISLVLDRVGRTEK